jgi:hypothetical protein
LEQPANAKALAKIAIRAKFLLIKEENKVLNDWFCIFTATVF